jgi:electron transfer flavoprotein beta subunit
VNIVVLVKQVPDSGLERNLRQDDKTVDRDAGNLVIGDLDEYAIEEALKLKEAHGGEVTVLTVGPEKATETIRKALSMGPDKAVHVTDAAIHGSDTIATSAIIAAALGKLEYDLVIAGAESTDGQTGALPAILAERLGIAQLTGARKLTVDGEKLTIERQTDDGYEVVEASTPAIVSVWDTINEPRYPSFKGIMQAKKKPVETYSLSDLGISTDQVGLDSAWSEVLEFAGRPPKGAGVKVPDEGDGGSKLVEFLASQKIV